MASGIPRQLASSSSLASLSRQRVAAQQAGATNGSELARPPISHVFLAEFDIDQGSILKHQYPIETGVDEHLLAEHMLPDGAHDRQEDWTVFYLNQIPSLSIIDPDKGKGKGKEQDGSSARTSTSTASSNEGSATGQKNEMLYVMSLVRTKKDATVRRGALVKALAVASHSPYIQVFKPVLLLALETYFVEPSSSCLARLYQSINSMDLSELPFLSLDERIVLRSTERKDFFEEKFIAQVPTYPSTTSSADTTSAHNHHQSIARTPSMPSLVGGIKSLNGNAEVLESHPSQSSSSGSISSLASAGRAQDGSLANLNYSTEESYTRSRANTMTSSEDGTSRSPFIGGTAPLPSSTATSMFGGLDTRSATPSASMLAGLKDTHWYESKVTFNSMTIPIRIPLSTFPEEIGDYSLIKLVQTFSSPNSLVSGPLHPHLHTSGSSTPPIIVLFNALVTNKRVVFLGHGHAAAQVANLVLAACALGSGCGAVLRGYVERAFPYTNLTNLDHLETVPAFIAGVCNPAFADRPSWWDVLCNIETGKIVISKDIRPSPYVRQNASTIRASVINEAMSPVDESDLVGGRTPVLSSMPTVGGGKEGGVGAQMGRTESFDHTFMEEILSSIASHHGEAAIRARFTDYVQRFVRIASKYEEDATGQTTIGYACSTFTSGSGALLGGGIFFPDEATASREMSINAGRVEAWRATPGYTSYQKSFAAHRESGPMRSIDLTHQLSRLRHARRMSAPEVGAIMRSLAEHARSSDECVVAILARLPAHYGGLMPLAFGLFHPSPIVRANTLDLFEILNSHPTGHKFILSLNAFHRSAYQRLSQEAEADRLSKQPDPPGSR